MKTAFKATIHGLAFGYGETEAQAIKKCTAMARRVYRSTKASGPLPAADKARYIGGKYLIASREGMTPFGHADTLAQAQKLRREALQLGLSGEIVEQ